jgi:hypothetical protein
MMTNKNEFLLKKCGVKVICQWLLHNSVIILIQLLQHVRVGIVYVSDMNNMVLCLVLLRMGRSQNSNAGGEQGVDLPSSNPEY